MPQPDPKDLRVDRMLTNISIGYKNAAYIADQIFPIVTVTDVSGIVPNFNQSAWFRDGAHLRAVGSPSRGAGFTTDITPKYACDRYSFRGEIFDDIRRQAQQPFNLDRETTEFVTDKCQMRREIAFASSFFTTSVWTDRVGGTDFTKWSDYGASTPLTDVSTFMDNVEGRIAREPNTLTMGKQVWVKTKWHPELIDMVKYTQKGQLTVDLVASLFEIEKIHIGRSIYTTSAEGTAEASVTYSRIWGKHALLLYVPSAPSLMTPAAGYTFVWQAVPNALQYIKRMRDEEREADILEANTYFDQKVTAARAGEFLQNVID